MGLLVLQRNLLLHALQLSQLVIEVHVLDLVRVLDLVYLILEVEVEGSW